MTTTAEGADVTQQGLYQALSEGGDPRLSTLPGMLAALNLRRGNNSVARP